MTKVLTDPQNYTNIANAIRAKNGGSATYKPAQMAAAVLAIETEPEIESLTVNVNGIYTAPSGVDGYSPVTVNVPSGGGYDILQTIIGNNCSLEISDGGGFGQIATGRFVMPAHRHTLDINLGFRPYSVVVYLHDDAQNLETYSCILTTPNSSSFKKGFYYQSDGYNRAYSPSASPSGSMGHVTNLISNGFTAYCLEQYFVGKTASYIAIGIA